MDLPTQNFRSLFVPLSLPGFIKPVPYNNNDLSKRKQALKKYNCFTSVWRFFSSVRSPVRTDLFDPQLSCVLQEWRCKYKQDNQKLHVSIPQSDRSGTREEIVRVRSRRADNWQQVEAARTSDESRFVAARERSQDS